MLVFVYEVGEVKLELRDTTDKEVDGGISFEHLSSLSPDILKLQLALPSVCALQTFYSIVNVVLHCFIFFQSLHPCCLLHI